MKRINATISLKFSEIWKLHRAAIDYPIGDENAVVLHKIYNAFKQELLDKKIVNSKMSLRKYKKTLTE